MRWASAGCAVALAVLGHVGPAALASGAHAESSAVGPRGAAAARPGPAAPLWRPPLVPTIVLRAFSPPTHDWLPGHRGVDLRARVGQPVRAAGSGTVRHAGTLAGRGVVVVDHGTVRTTYEPVQAEVARGARVSAGDRLGIVARGSGHCGSGRCLHLGLRRGRTYLDPLLLWGSRAARLRPWEP